MSDNGQDITIGNQQERQHFKIGYILGLIDGEGHLGLRSDRQANGHITYSPILQVACTDFKIINQFAKYMGELGFSICLYEIKGKGFHRKSLRFYLRGMKRIEPILTLLLQYPFAKHKQAEILKQYIDYRKSNSMKRLYGIVEKSFKDKMTDLNRRASAKSSETIRSGAT